MEREFPDLLLVVKIEHNVDVIDRRDGNGVVPGGYVSCILLADRHRVPRWQTRHRPKPGQFRARAIPRGEPGETLFDGCGNCAAAGCRCTNPKTVHVHWPNSRMCASWTSRRPRPSHHVFKGQGTDLIDDVGGVARCFARSRSARSDGPGTRYPAKFDLSILVFAAVRVVIMRTPSRRLAMYLEASHEQCWRY